MSSAGKVSHIGIAVSDLEKAISKYSLLLGDDSPVVESVADQKVKVAIFSSGQDVSGRIELVAPTDPSSPVQKFIDKRGEGLHHLCIYVDNIESTLAKLKANGVRLIDETPRTGAGGAKIAFVHPSGCNGVLVELEERNQQA